MNAVDVPSKYDDVIAGAMFLSASDNSTFLQLRVTTEDSSANFQPDSGHLEVYRSSGGIGVRQDSACSTGSVITGHYDSLLVKLIATGITYVLCTHTNTLVLFFLLVSCSDAALTAV